MIYVALQVLTTAAGDVIPLGGAISSDWFSTTYEQELLKAMVADGHLRRGTIDDMPKLIRRPKQASKIVRKTNGQPVSIWDTVGVIENALFPAIAIPAVTRVAFS